MRVIKVWMVGTVVALVIGGWSCQKKNNIQEPITLSKSTDEIRFLNQNELAEAENFVDREAFTRAVTPMLEDIKKREMANIQAAKKSGGGLEIPIPCDKLLKYLSEYAGIDLSDIACLARGKIMFPGGWPPEWLDFWLAANISYALNYGRYIGGAGFIGASFSLAGVEQIDVYTQVYVDGFLDTLMYNWDYSGDGNVAFNAGAVVWTSQNNPVTLQIITDHGFSHRGYSWNPVLTKEYQY